jgi:hypothetical protein
MEPENPSRHGCLTTYLVFMLLANTATCLVYLLAGDKIIANFPAARVWSPYVLGVGCLVNVVLVLALFWWQKWAFYTNCMLAVVIFFVNVFAVGVNPIGAILGLLGPVILYAVFQIGGETKGWKYLK